jgi:hypothetical protein
MYLTKSDFKVARECPTKLYYKKLKYPSLLDEDPFLEFLADGGYMVEKMAKLLFPEGVEMPVGAEGPEAAFAAARRGLEAHENSIQFEPTMLAGKLLARVDILEKNGNALRLIEVKSTSVDMASDGPMPFRGKKGSILSEKKHYLEDVTFQTLVLRRAFPNWAIKPMLCVVDKSKLATANGTCDKFRLLKDGGRRMASDVEYCGNLIDLPVEHLLAFVDVTNEVNELMPEVEKYADFLATSLLEGEPTKIAPALGLICKKCEYRVTSNEGLGGFSECWGDLASVRPHVLDFYRPDGLRAPGKQDPISLLTKEGKAGLVDIPEEWLSGAYADRQRIQLQHTSPDREYLATDLRTELSTHVYPLHFIDFEASRPALPYHAGMHPYQLAAFQWSCHTIVAPGAEIVHREWINIEPVFPNFEFARSLKETIGDEGTVYVWSHFEQTTLRDIRQHMDALGEDDAKLAAWLEELGNSNCSRIVDMEKLAKSYHFHPRMGGRTSIKVVLPAVWENNSTLWQYPYFSKYHCVGSDGHVQDPYKTLVALPLGGHDDDLEMVQEGTAAIRAYQDLVFGRGAENSEAKEALRRLLLQYCELDTAAMVMIWMHWMGRAL